MEDDYNNPVEIDIADAFKEAWRGFKGWWIPLCVVSSILLFSQSWLPELIIKNFPEFKIVDKYIAEYENYKKEMDSGKSPVNATTQFMRKVSDLNEHPDTVKNIKTLLYKIIIFFGILLVLVSVLHVVIILMSKFSISDKKESIKDSAGKPFTLTPSYILLAIIKIIPLFFFILPFFYFYVKLYFTGFIITEESANPFKAMKKSWELTDGIFWPTLSIFLITLAIDIMSMITIIGFIPGTSFKYTLRASLYKQAQGLKILPPELPERI